MQPIRKNSKHDIKPPILAPALLHPIPPRFQAPREDPGDEEPAPLNVRLNISTLPLVLLRHGPQLSSRVLEAAYGLVEHAHDLRRDCLQGFLFRREVMVQHWYEIEEGSLCLSGSKHICVFRNGLASGKNSLTISFCTEYTSFRMIHSMMVSSQRARMALLVMMRSGMRILSM
jgi:hypothetical protein